MTFLTVALMSVGLGGCGGDDKPESAGASSSSSTPATASESAADDSPAGYPACEDVWVVGQPLPEGYAGCYEAERNTVEVAASFVCADGSELSSYKDRWWVLGDGVIAEAAGGETASDADYAAAYSKCSP
jgi:hypothetical protein